MPFVKGKSGNPSGRRKVTDEEKKALDDLKKLAPLCVAKTKEMLDDPAVPAATKAKLICMVLDRTYGTPIQTVQTTVDMPDCGVVLMPAVKSE